MSQNANKGGFEAQDPEMRNSLGPQFFSNGEPVSKAGKWDEFGNNNQSQIPAWKQPMPNLDIPELYPDKQSTKSDGSLKWYEQIWAGLPLALIFLGGALGGLIGAIAMAVNTKIFKAELNGFVKYLLSGIVTLSAFGLHLGLAILITIAMGR